MIDQLIIATSGVAAVWMSQDKKESRRRLAPLFGIIGQPAWFYAAITGEQWGILALSVLYTWAWGRGFVEHWVNPFIRG